MKKISENEAGSIASDIKKEKEFVKCLSGSYKFPCCEPSTSVELKIGEQKEAYCLSAFNEYIDSVDAFERAIYSQGHHPITGPFHIGKLQSGEDILVCLDKIAPFHDCTWCLTKSAGVLAETWKDSILSIEDRRVHLLGQSPLNKHQNPMLGIIGTIAEHEEIGSGRGNSHGGNLDLPCIKEGSMVILPSKRCCSHIWFGDMHAQQGYGELAGVAAECSGEVRFRMYPVKLLQKTTEPIVILKENDTYSVYFVGCRMDFESAVKAAVENAMRYQEVWETTDSVQTYEKIGLTGNLVVGQAIGKTVSVAVQTEIKELEKLINCKTQYIKMYK